jgi:undecaprenyl pyrophosphate phosphatase UppP
MRAGWTVARNVMIAFVPSAAIGFAAKDWIKGNLFNPAAVVTALAVDFLVRYLGKHTLALFGWWRLAVAGAVLAASWLLGLTLSP